MEPSPQDRKPRYSKQFLERLKEIKSDFDRQFDELDRLLDEHEANFRRQMAEMEARLDRRVAELKSLVQELEERVAPDGDDAPHLVCRLDCIHAIVEALSSTRWKSHQDAVMEISEHGVVITIEESGCLQAKVFLKRELFVQYDYAGDGCVRLGVSLGLLIDSLNTFSSLGRASTVEIQYPGPDMQLLLRSVGSLDVYKHAEVKTTISDAISCDFQFEHAGNTPLSFTVKSACLKQTINDLKWPGSSIQVRMQPDPPSVILKGEGRDHQIEYPYYAKPDILIAFQCDREVSYRYNYNFLRAITSNIPSSVMKKDGGTKLQIGRGGMLKIQHLISVAKPGGNDQTSRIVYVEFFVKPEEEDDNLVNDD